MASSKFNRVFAVSCIACVALFNSATASIVSYFLEDGPKALAQRDPILGTTGVSLLPASPDCWLDAIQALKIQTGSVLEAAFFAASSEDGSHALNSMTCSWLTSVDQKVLALELSKCQLQDLERPLFKFDNDEDHIACSNVLQEYKKVQVGGTEKQQKGNQAKMSRDISSKCLSRFTDIGINSYTYFFSYVNQLCTRLLSEFVLTQYYETSHHLASSSKVAEEKIQKIIEQQDKLFQSWTEREKLVLGMYDELETRVVKQTDGLESKIASLRRKLEEEHEHWTHEYQKFKERLESELEKQQKEFAVFAGVIHKIQEAWFSLTTPIESFWQSVQVGHSLFRGTFLYSGSLICSIVMTHPQVFRWMRSFIAMLLMIGLMVEVSILFTTRPGQEKASFWRDEYLQECQTLRDWLFTILYAYYLLGVVRSIIYGCCRVQNEDETPCTTNRNQEANVYPCLFQQNMQPFASKLQQESIGPSAFQSPAMFVYGSGRTPSAAKTDASHDTADQLSVAAPSFVMKNGMSYGMHNPYLAPPHASMACKAPGRFAPLSKAFDKSCVSAHNSNRAQRSTVAASQNQEASLLHPTLIETPKNTKHARETSRTTPLINHLQGDQAMESDKTYDAPKESSKKRPILDVTEEEMNAKRACVEEREEVNESNDDNKEDVAKNQMEKGSSKEDK
jgi:hypothetical protein